MIKKTIGIILIIIGIAGIIISFEQVRTIIPITQLQQISTTMIIIVSIIILIIGTFIMQRKNSQSNEEEVPIYRGKKIIGYRRS